MGKKTPTKDGYYTEMEMDMKTGKSKFVGFRKITFQDRVDGFVIEHPFLIPFISSLFGDPRACGART